MSATAALALHPFGSGGVVDQTEVMVHSTSVRSKLMEFVTETEPELHLQERRCLALFVVVLSSNQCKWAKRA